MIENKVQKQLSLSDINFDNIPAIGIAQLAEQKDLTIVDLITRKAGNQYVEKICNSLRLSGFHLSIIADHIICEKDDCIISFSTGSDRLISIFAKTFDYINQIVKSLGNFITRNDFKGKSISYYYEDRGHVSTRFINPKEYCQIFPELYPDILIDKLCQEFLTSNENILLLYGSPGVGKTTFIKYLININVFENIGYAKDKAVFENGSFWPTLISHENDLLILDDLDFGLKARTETNHIFMNNLLSFSDGALNTGTKIVITTNQKIDEIDSALIRPGRCFDFLVLNSLNQDQAKQIWLNIFKNDEITFNKIFKNFSQITQASLVSENSRVKNNLVERSYIIGNDKKYSIEEKIEKLGIQVKNRDNQLGFG